MNKTDSKAFFINPEFQVISDADAPDTEGAIQVTSMEQLVGFPKDELLKIHSSCFNRPSTPADTKKSVKKLAGEIFKELDRDEGGEKPAAGSDEKPAPKEKKPSKMDRIKEIVKERGTILRDDLAGLIGSDATNTHTMVSILRNAKRTKEPVDIQYDKTLKMYAWPGVDFPEPPAEETEKPADK